MDLDKLKKELAIEEALIGETLRLINQALERKKKGPIELAAIGAFLQDIYNGIENSLKRIMKYEKVTLPQSPSYHKDLLDIAVEKDVISQSLSERLDPYRAFRHFFVHGYGINLNPDQLFPLAQNVGRVWRRVHKQFNAYLDAQS